MDESYEARIRQETEWWARQIKHETSGYKVNWLFHPIIAECYVRRMVNGSHWIDFVKHYFGGSARLGLDLGCGIGVTTRLLLEHEAVEEIVGYDISEPRLNEARKIVEEKGLNATFERYDINTAKLEEDKFDLVFSAHSFHHFVNLEHIMGQVKRTLKDNGLFVLEEYVGPSRFQWSELQLRIARDLLQVMPERYRRLPSGEVKSEERRPTLEQMEREDPFEAVRSTDILHLFYENFRVLHHCKLGGTIQNPLYHDIMNNFDESDPVANQILIAIDDIEQLLVGTNLLPSDFSLVIGTKKNRLTDKVRRKIHGCK